MRHLADGWAERTAGRLLAGEHLRLTGPGRGPLPYLGLYQGVAGVGYALLATRDSQLPNLVAWC